MSKRLANLGEELRQAREQSQKVEKEDVTEVQEEAAPQPPKATRKRSERVRHTVYLPPDISYRVRLEKVNTGDEISEIVTKACELYFKNQDR